jgi:hypothetical protein
MLTNPAKRGTKNPTMEPKSETAVVKRRLVRKRCADSTFFDSARVLVYTSVSQQSPHC